MIKLKKIVIVLFITIFFSNYSIAENKTVILDLDYILSNTKVGKKIFKELETIEKNKIEELKIEEKNLKNQENKILASKNIISSDELNIKIKDFQNKLNDYKKIKNNEIDKLKKKKK